MKTLKLLLLFLILSTLNAKELQKVSLQLQWLDQFQFAGYYIAKEKGYYKDVGLHVEIKKFDNNINTVEEVLSKRATYAIGRSSLVIEKSNGANLKLLASIFQSSPSILLAREDSKIISIKDFVGKKIMMTSDVADSISVYALQNKYKISTNDMIIQEHSFDINDLINKKTDLMASYISNEPFLMQEKGIAYKIFDPKDYGFDIYSDLLFTSKNEINNHTKRAVNFKNASIKGWEYAFANIDETIDLILKKYNPQKKSKKALLYEASELKKLAYFKTNQLGKIEKNKIQRIYDIYNLLGLVNNKIDIDDLIFVEKEFKSEQLSEEEKQYLKNKKTITVCNSGDFAPFMFEKDGKDVGILIDYLNQISKQQGFYYKVITSADVNDHFKMIEKSKCDISSLIATDLNNHKFLTPTISIIEDEVVLVTKINEAYIYDLSDLKNEKIAIRKGQGTLKKYVEHLYPNIKLIEVDGGGLKGVKEGKYYGYISVSYFVGHKIATNYFYNLKIMTKIGEGKIRGSFGISNKEPLLVGIFNKAVQSISQEQRRDTISKWVSIYYMEQINYAFIKKMIFLFSIGLFIITLFLIKQNRLKTKIQELNLSLEERIQTATKDLRTAQKLAKIGSWRFENFSGKLSWSDETYDIFEVDKNIDKVKVIDDFYKIIYSEDLELVKQAYNKHIKTKEKYVVTHRVFSKDKKIKYVEERCESIFDVNGMLLLSKGTVQDVTEQKMQDQYMIRQSRLAQMGEMISMIAHQWRQPLGAISAISIDMKMQLELETYDFDNKEDKKLFHAYFLKSFDNIDRMIQGLTNTITDFKDFYKPNKNINVQVINEPIFSALTIMENSLKVSNIKVIKSFLYTQKIEIYSNELVQVFLNILKNAKDNFAEQNIKDEFIEITTVEDNNGVIIEISDNGGGINDDIIDSIFDPYFSTKDDKNGTGLGLYMSKLIVEEHHNGKINVENLYDNNHDKIGTKFLIKLNKQINNKKGQI